MRGAAGKIGSGQYYIINKGMLFAFVDFISLIS